MRKRRKARRNRENQNLSKSLSENLCENLCENFNESLNNSSNLPCENIEVDLSTEELPEISELEDVDIGTIIKCEADFFCKVIRRLSKEINCAHDMDDLEDIISLAAKFLQASADKEKAIACQIAASKGVCSTGKKSSNCIYDLEEDAP